MKKPTPQRNLSVLIVGYQQAYWQASSLDARNGIALKLWTVRREAQMCPHPQPHRSGAEEKAHNRLADAILATRFPFIVWWPLLRRTTVIRR